MRFRSIASVEQYLDEIPKFQSKGASAANFNLDRFREFCRGLGRPQDQFASVHVAGTNGKGSTCHILGSVFSEAGYKTGVYTSPHIFSLRERFKINDDFISDEALLDFFRQFEERITEYQLTYFEICTAVAFWWFARQQVDIAVIEVGLGGRLDATNIITPEVSVITSIGLDHTDILGDTLSEITREKGGIIKKGRPLVIGDLPAEALEVVQEIARQKHAPVLQAMALSPHYIKPGRYELTVNKRAVKIRTNLVAPVHAKNLAIAWRVCEQLQDPLTVTEKQFLSGVQTVDIGYGRFDRLHDTQLWYFDGGHNLEAVKMMKETLKTIGEIDEANLVLSMMKDKVRPEVLAEFSEFKNIYYYTLGLERAATFADIKKQLPQVHSLPAGRNHQSLLNDFDSELVIFAGSFYFYETVRDWVSTFVINH